MELKEHKLEIGLAILCVLLLTGLFRVFGSFFSAPRIEVGNISYEMPRPKSDIVGEFALGDREIDRRYNNPFEKKAKADERKPLAANVKPAAAPAVAARKAAGQWMAIRQPQHNVRVIDRANRGGLGSDTSHANAYQAAPGQPHAPEGNGAVAGDKQNAKVSAEQWVALLNAQPTKENMRKFAAAYSAGEIDSQTFYSTLTGMLDKENQEQRLLAIYGLGLVPEALGFSTVARRMGGLPNGEVKDQAMAYLQSFSAPTRHSSLLVALKSDEPVVEYYAAHVFLNGLNGTQAGGTRPGRGEGTLSSGSYRQFVPIFQEMQNKGDESVRNLASEILMLLGQVTA